MSIAVCQSLASMAGIRAFSVAKRRGGDARFDAFVAKVGQWRGFADYRSFNTLRKIHVSMTSIRMS
jgi:hypothetical protein